MLRLALRMFLGDRFDELLDPGSNRQYLAQHGLGILRHEQVCVVAANLSQLGHKLLVAFDFGKGVAKLQKNQLNNRLVSATMNIPFAASPFVCF